MRIAKKIIICAIIILMVDSFIDSEAKRRGEIIIDLIDQGCRDRAGVNWDMKNECSETINMLKKYNKKTRWNR